MAIEFASASSESYYRTASVSGDVFSMCAWSYLNNQSSVQTVLCLSDTAADNNFYRLQFNNGTPGYRFSQADNASGVTSAQTTFDPGTGSWHHVVGVARANNDRSCWVDGANEVTGSTTKSSISSIIDTIGVGVLRETTDSAYHDGRIFWPAVWQGYALTASDVAALYAGIPPWKIAPDNLIFFSPFGSADGTPRDWMSGTALTVSGTPFTAEGPHVSSDGALWVPHATITNTIITVPTGPWR